MNHSFTFPFNIYIDTLVQMAEDREIRDSSSMNLFANDLLGLSANSSYLQRFLSLCVDWGQDYGMT